MTQKYTILFGGGQKTVTTAGARESLATGTDEKVIAVIIRALATNTTNVYVGGPVVSSTDGGTILAPGDAVTIKLTLEEFEHGLELDLSKIWLDVDTDGEGVSYLTTRV